MAASTQKAPYYYIPNPSQYPVMASFGLLLMATGAGAWVNGYGFGSWVLLAGLLWLLFVLYNWFGQAISESEGGLYGQKVDGSFRWSMSWFIFSEVMFFAAFFGALYWARAHAVPNLADLDNKILWPDFKGVWPSSAPGYTASPAGTIEPFQVIGPWPIPTINTALLLTSGITLTIAHHALIAGNRQKVINWMIATIVLGVTFLGLQAYEYHHAYTELNLKLSSGIFGSTFFMLTGFHGFHVCMGAIMLTVVLLRIMKGHFTPERHFAFEGAAWYWHFVDVVWIGLYVVVYWL
jgi:cytochrome c oxidase subunit 3